MHSKREKVVVAMSGGVDSSVAACLLVEQGYEVMGLFMRTGLKDPKSSGSAEGHESPAAQGEKSASRHQGCCSASDAADARFVAGMLGIPFYALNFEREFDTLIDHFADEYARGRTPNPCIVCNDRLKFGRIVEYADAVGARYIATGHYARVGRREAPVENRCHKRAPIENPGSELEDSSGGGQTVLMRGRDEKKDQSYVLFGLDRAILQRVLFPVGELTKDEARAIARRFNLPNCDKPDSVEICFAPDRDYARVVCQRRPEAFAEGDVIDGDGRVLGRHKGVPHYTVGQRRGLGIAAGVPIYVTRLDVEKNTVTVGEGDALMHSALVADRAGFQVDPPDGPFRAEVKIRYLHKAAPATVEPLDGERVRVVFDKPQRAIAPGQAVVFYDGDVVLGGAWIERVDACDAKVRVAPGGRL